MADRPRRALRQLNYRRVSLVGFEDDSSDEDGRDTANPLYEDHSDEDNPELSEDEADDHDSEDDEDALVGTGSVIARDGTIWTKDQPTSVFPPWRSGLTNYEDGPTGAAKIPQLSIADTFKLLLTDDVLSDICYWTNKFAKHVTQNVNNRHPPPKIPKKWDLLTKTELRAFIGLLLLAGIEKAKKKPWSEMWSKSEAIRCPPFTATLSEKRFYGLVSMLRFDNVIERRKLKIAADAVSSSSQLPSTSKSSTPPYNTLDPIKDISSRIISKFSELYEPAAKLCVDEQLVKFRGNCPFRVYMPDKPGKYGIKVWACVDDSSGYILKLQIYQGQKPSGREVGQGMRVVTDLVSDYYGSKRGVIADNFFSSMQLVQELLQHEMTFVGTIRKNRKEIPSLMKDIKQAPAKSSLFLFHEPSSTTLLRYLPNKTTYVLLISSAHCDKSMVSTKVKDIEKPAVIDYYNATKGGVDTADQMISTYTCQFPSKRFSMKLFLHLIDCCALNAYVIWIKNHPDWNQTTKSRRRLFIRELAYQLISPQIRSRAYLINNLQTNIQSAMEIMGVTYKRSLSPTRVKRQKCNISDGSKKQGRCPFCDKNPSKQKVSQRKCFQCDTFICQTHWEYICPDCVKKTLTQQTTAMQQDPHPDEAAESEVDSDQDEVQAIAPEPDRDQDMSE